MDGSSTSKPSSDSKSIPPKTPGAPIVSVPKGRPAPPKMARPPAKPPDIKKAAPGAAGNAAVLGRKLHWDALQGNKIEGTVFQELNQDILFAEDLTNLIDVEQMKRIFAKSSGAKGGRRGTIIAELDNKRKIISGNRAQNIAIVLSRLSQPIPNIAKQLETMNTDDSLNRELVEKVMDIAPNPDEIKEYEVFLKNKEDFESLRDVEKKYFPFFAVVRMREKCRVLLSRLRFPEYEQDVTNMLDILYRGGSEVRKSQKFRALLVAVLLWGNFVNHGVDEETSVTSEPKGSAEAVPVEEEKDKYGRRRRKAGTAALEIRTFGFTLPSLLKLAEFKTSVDPSITSLHYIVSNMIQSQPKIELQRLCEEMPTVTEASRISASGLKEAISNLQSEIQCLNSEISLKNAEEVYGAAPLQRIRDFHTDFKQRYDLLLERSLNVTTFVGETAAYFGDAKMKVRSEAHEEFFKTLHLFLIKFQNCVKDYFQNTQKFKAILIESAQNRGLTYIQPEGPTPKAPGSRPTSGPPKGKSKQPSSLSHTTKPNVDSSQNHLQLDETGTTDIFESIDTTTTVTEMTNGVLATPQFVPKRLYQRRASVGVVNKNIILPIQKQVDLQKIQMPPPRIRDPSSPPPITPTTNPLASSPQFKRSSIRRSTAGGAFYGLGGKFGKFGHPVPIDSTFQPQPAIKSKMGSDTPSTLPIRIEPGLPSPIPLTQHVSFIDTSKEEIQTTSNQFSDGTQQEFQHGSNTRSALQLPEHRHFDCISDSELEPRKSRQYVLDKKTSGILNSTEQIISQTTTQTIDTPHLHRLLSQSLERIDSTTLSTFRNSHSQLITRKKSKAEMEASDAVYRGIGHILNALDDQQQSPNVSLQHSLTQRGRKREGTTTQGVYAAFDEAVDTFIKTESMLNRSVEDYLRHESYSF